MNDLTIEQRVEKGIGWLEEHGGVFWAERIVAAIEGAGYGFGIFGGQTCPFAVTFQTTWWGTWGRSEGTPHPPSMEDAWRYGFDARHLPKQRDGYAPPDWEDAKAVVAEWERQARSRLAWLADLDAS